MNGWIILYAIAVVIVLVNLAIELQEERRG